MCKIQHKANKIKAIIRELNSKENIYDYLLYLGKRQNKNKLLQIEYEYLGGCQANIFIKFEVKNDCVILWGYSDSIFISGIIALVFKVYNQASIKELYSLDKYWHMHLNLENILTSVRWESLKRIILYITDNLDSFLLFNSPNI